MLKIYHLLIKQWYKDIQKTHNNKINMQTKNNSNKISNKTFTKLEVKKALKNQNLFHQQYSLQILMKMKTRLVPRIKIKSRLLKTLINLKPASKEVILFRIK